MQAMSNKVCGFPNAHEGKAWVQRTTIQWLQSLDIDDAIIETNNQQVVTSLRKQRVDSFEFGIIGVQCSRLLLDLPNFKVCFEKTTR